MRTGNSVARSLRILTAATSLFVLGVPAASDADTFYYGYGAAGPCYGGLTSFTPITASIPCSGWDSFNNPVDVLVMGLAGYVDLGAYVQVSSPGVPNFSATFGSIATIVVQGGTGSGILRATVNVSGVDSINPPGSSSAYFGFMGGIQLFGPGVATLDIPFIFGVPFGFQQELNAGITFGPASGISNYLNTASLAPFQIFDPNLQPLFGTSVTSNSGFQYAVAQVTQVPEPASLTLMGLGCVVGFARRHVTRERSRRARAV